MLNGEEDCNPFDMVYEECTTSISANKYIGSWDVHVFHSNNSWKARSIGIPNKTGGDAAP